MLQPYVVVHVDEHNNRRSHMLDAECHYRMPWIPTGWTQMVIDLNSRLLSETVSASFERDLCHRKTTGNDRIFEFVENNC